MERIVNAAGSQHSISGLVYHHGRHEISMAPGFCGTPVVILGTKSPDSVSFSCSCQLEIGTLHTLILASGHQLEILVDSRENGTVHAIVLDRHGRAEALPEDAG